MTVFEQYPVGSWKVGSLAILKFPVIEITEDGGNRVVERERPYRDGAKLDDTGSKAKCWVLTVKFENSLQEPNLDESTLLYPTVLNELIASFDIHETGDLTVPTRGIVRARAESYTRHEKNSERDEALVTFTFREDSEDNVGNQSFEQLSVNASARRLAEQAELSALDEGTWNTSLSDLREFGSDLEAFANFPGDTVADVDSQASIVIGTTNRVGRAFTRESEANRNQLNDPELSLTQRKLLETEDMAARARAEAFEGRPRAVPFFVQGESDLFTIAARLDQLPEDLIAVNPDRDPLFIPKGSTIKVMESA